VIESARGSKSGGGIAPSPAVSGLWSLPGWKKVRAGIQTRPSSLTACRQQPAAFGYHTTCQTFLAAAVAPW